MSGLSISLGKGLVEVDSRIVSECRPLFGSLSIRIKFCTSLFFNHSIVRIFNFIGHLPNLLFYNTTAIDTTYICFDVSVSVREEADSSE